MMTDMAESSMQTAEELLNIESSAWMELAKDWGPGAAHLGLRILAALLIVLIGSRIVRMVRRILGKTLEKTSMDLNVRRFLVTAAEVGIYLVVVFMAADSIGIPSASIIAVLGSAGLAVGLSLQESLSNVAGGIVIMAMRPFIIGDYIRFDDMEGTVSSIGLVYTTLVTSDSQKITVPNGAVANKVVTNTTAQKKRRVDLEIRVVYTADTALAMEILTRLFRADSRVLKEEPLMVFVADLEENAVRINARGWVLTDDYWDVKWALTGQIKTEFDQAGIGFAYNRLYGGDEPAKLHKL
ncbi:MAG: mechanosensitive ion channel [Eubacteriales bacterium]|nr:mechanosensitive ion channel [Eubacteriales bacterium]